MQNNSNISDELLTRYLCGDVSDIERQQIEDYLAESDEHLTEMLTITAAIEQFGKKQHKRRSLPVWRTISAAASIALLIGIGITLRHNYPSGSAIGIDPAPAYASQDSIAELITEDSL